MKDMINERLILLATAQESMTDVTEQWDGSQLIVEKSTFETMNVSDKILNLSKEGNCLIKRIQECYHGNLVGANPDEAKKIAVLLKEVQGLFHNILENAAASNEISHNLEREVASQRDIKDDIKTAVGQISVSIDSAVACAEFMLAEL